MSPAAACRDDVLHAGQGQAAAVRQPSHASHLQAPGRRRRRAKWPVTSESAPRPRVCCSSASNLMARLQARSGLGVSPRAYLHRQQELQLLGVLLSGPDAAAQSASTFGSGSPLQEVLKCRLFRRQSAECAVDYRWASALCHQETSDLRTNAVAQPHVSARCSALMLTYM